MASDTNPDFDQQAAISWRTPPEGSCLTPEIMAQIASLIVITLPKPKSGPIPLSTEPNNLAQLDAAAALYVPGVNIFQDQKTWLPSAPGNVTFSGWPAGIDATSALAHFYYVCDPSDAGNVKFDPVGRTPTLWTFAVSGAALAVQVFFELYQFPVAPEPA